MFLTCVEGEKKADLFEARLQRYRIPYSFRNLKLRGVPGPRLRIDFYYTFEDEHKLNIEFLIFEMEHAMRHERRRSRVRATPKPVEAFHCCAIA